MANNKDDDYSDDPLEPEVQRVSGSSFSDSKSEKSFLPNMKTRWILAFIVGVLLCVAYSTLSLRSPMLATKSNSEELDPGQVEKRQVLPDYVFKDANGKASKLSDYHGQVLILSFWASWCSPCLIELPTFSQMQKKLKNQGLSVLAVNVEDGDDGKKFATDFWARNKFDFLSFFDTSKELAESFQVELLPSNFVIDKSGRLAFSGFGSTDWGSAQIVDLIDGLLQEPEVQVASRPAVPVRSAQAAAPAKSDQNHREEEESAEDDPD